MAAAGAWPPASAPPPRCRSGSTTDALVGSRITQAAARDAVGDALANIEPLADLHASAGYRRRVALSLAVRAIMDAHQAAQTRGAHAG